mmetsp:Transcript_15869/g.28792  ORF Transcript_15869/g.28792 Transcript_15869/m.28792 type:complete len:92 (+) Transcript_15869:17-292(+)|eukprot:CAMPEP_0202035080 /NCGR_PEP_ID=MMETSP0905-20130828/66895_1 /ASSEMBLY_ACC=CAM_ASM_000554 /TAXON_ID=420261 /ORGANISM="Thalassiosira antarctica, Strain CCMP982" /LENGTH=91 /DNA_ID=CAMNT_0048599033 /DNA_START=655 /DNA_END=930 /DNA_ORIENTATION=+
MLCHSGELFDKIVEKATLSKKSKSCDGGNQQEARMPRESSIRYSRPHPGPTTWSIETSSHENVLFTEKDTNESLIQLIGYSTHSTMQSNDQ